MNPAHDFDVLAAAYRQLSGREPPDLEVRIMNLHNHLIWGTYRPEEDPINDAIVEAAERLLFYCPSKGGQEPCLST